MNACKDCPVFKQIRGLGDELRKLSINTADDGLEGLDEPKRRIEEHLSVDQYLTYKKQEMKDSDIASLIGFPNGAVRKWKKRNGVGDNRVTNYKARG